MWFLAIAAAALLVLAQFARSPVTVEVLSEGSRRVQLEGRSYLVVRLGSGKYSVAFEGAPLAALTFGQEGAPFRVGDARQLEQLERDMKRFPSDLFPGLVRS